MKHIMIILLLMTWIRHSVCAQLYTLVDEVHLYMEGKKGGLQNQHIMQVKSLIRQLNQYPSTLVKIYSYTDKNGFYDDNLIITGRRLDQLLAILKQMLSDNRSSLLIKVSPNLLIL